MIFELEYNEFNANEIRKDLQNIIDGLVTKDFFGKLTNDGNVEVRSEEEFIDGDICITSELIETATNIGINAINEIRAKYNNPNTMMLKSKNMNGNEILDETK